MIVQQMSYLFEYSVTDSRNQLTELTEWFKQLEEQEAYLKACAEARHLPVEVFKSAGCFFVDEEFNKELLKDEWLHETLGFVKFNELVYAGRLVYPIYDVSNRVMGFTGWDKFARPKYLDSVNHGYKAKKSTFYGMEMLKEYYTNNKTVFVVEGIVCCLVLRMLGYQALASLGSYLTKYQIQILKRFGERLVVIPDSDEAGNKYVNQVKKELKEARVLQPREMNYDIDELYHKNADGLIKDLETISNPFLFNSEMLIVR